ncbi:MAG: endonuclease/exonuclease/phosphatase family protein [Caldilineaceae bacterium]|nr:endonuclease/exonuclease/phosphatase family protein [Caldilineaceae bacterium]
MSNTHGSAILVKRDAPIRESSAEVIHLPAESPRPLLTTYLILRGYGVRLLNLHLTRPANFWGDAFQKIELAALGFWRNPDLALGSSWREVAEGYHVRSLRIENGPLIVAGDFNVTPWSPRFQRLLREARLKNSMRGFGMQNSWPSVLPLPLGIPIDHALHSPSLTTLDRKTVRVAGTDHAMLVVTFGF